MGSFTDTLLEEFTYDTPYYEDILSNNINWIALKFIASKIGNKYRKPWYIQTYYMLNAYIGEKNNLKQISDPAIADYINSSIKKYCAEHPEQLEIYLHGKYKFNPYPNDHEKLDEVEKIDPTQNVTDIISCGDPIPGFIYDIDSKNTAEGGQGTDKMHKADAIMYNDQDTGEVTFYLSKYGNRDLRGGLNTYTKICTIPGPINYKRLTYINGFPSIVDFSNKEPEDKCLKPHLSLQATDILKKIAEKNSEYVSQHLDKYGSAGQDLVDAYDYFRKNAVDIFSITWAVVSHNKLGQPMYNLRVVYAGPEGHLDYIIFKNISYVEVETLKQYQ